MSGCHCGQAGSMFCESCSDLRCKELMEYSRDAEGDAEEHGNPDRQKEKEDWDEFNKNIKKEKEEFLNILYNLYEEND